MDVNMIDKSFEETRSDVHLIKNEITSIKLKLTILHNALVGSELTSDGGLIKRIIESEGDLDKLREKIYKLEKRDDSLALYVRIIWALVSGVVATVGTLLISHFMK